jgi:hypothetical protein
MWQDVALLGVNLIFGFLLVPQIFDVYRKKQALNLITCITTAGALSLLCFIYASLGLWLAVTGDLIDVGAWVMLLILSILVIKKVI